MKCQSCSAPLPEGEDHLGDICPVCGWEEDILDADGTSSANSGLSPAGWATWLAGRDWRVAVLEDQQ